jgi:hypothetical protein
VHGRLLLLAGMSDETDGLLILASENDSPTGPPQTESIAEPIESVIPPWKAYGALAVVSFSFFADNFGAMIVTPVVTEVEQGGQKTNLVDGDAYTHSFMLPVSPSQR